MKKLTMIAALVVVAGACATEDSHAYSDSFRNEIAGASGVVTGYQYVCDYDDQAYPCPHPEGRIFASRAEADADLDAHLKEYPAHRSKAGIRSVEVQAR